MIYTAPIQTDSDGELMLVFPEEMMEELNWSEGDELIWKQLDNGSWSLTKRENSNSE